MNLINREALMFSLVFSDETGNIPCGQMKTILEVVKAQPLAQPKIIHCRDCKYWMPYDWMFSEVWKSKNMEDYPENEIGCMYADMSMSATDFCSRAERREVSG